MGDKEDGARPKHEDHISRPVRASPRSPWNWFGALFGVVVLIGGSVLYVTSDGESAADEEQVVAVEEAGPHGEAEPAEEAETHDESEPAEGGSGEDRGKSGKHSSTKKAGAKDGVIEIEMVEFGYLPTSVDIPAGKPVTLRFTNTGKVVHEAMIGDAHMQEEFAAADGHEDADGDAGHHADVMAVTVEPGKTADLKVVIDEPGEWFLGCHLTGHWEAGMVGKINVT